MAEPDVGAVFGLDGPEELPSDPEVLGLAVSLVPAFSAAGLASPSLAAAGFASPSLPPAGLAPPRLSVL